MTRNFTSWIAEQAGRADVIGQLAKALTTIKMPAFSTCDECLTWAKAEYGNTFKEWCEVAWTEFAGEHVPQEPMQNSRVIAAQKLLSKCGYLAWLRIGRPKTMPSIESAVTTDETIIAAVLSCLANVDNYESSLHLLASRLEDGEPDVAETIVRLKVASDALERLGTGKDLFNFDVMDKALTCMVSYGNESQVEIAVAFIETAKRPPSEYCTTEGRDGIIFYGQGRCALLQGLTARAVSCFKKAVAAGNIYAQYELLFLEQPEDSHTLLKIIEQSMREGDMRHAYGAAFIRFALQKQGSNELVIKSARAGNFPAFGEAAIRLARSKKKEHQQEAALFALIAASQQNNDPSQTAMLLGVTLKFNPAISKIDQNERFAILLDFISGLGASSVMEQTLILGAAWWAAIYTPDILEAVA